MSDELAPEKPILELPEAVPAWAVSLIEAVQALKVEARATRTDVCDHLHDIREQVTALTASERRLVDEVNSINNWRHSQSIEIQHLATHSSDADLAHESKLADEIVARLELAKDVADTKTEVAAIKAETLAQTKILTATANQVGKFLATPTVKIFGGILLGAVSSYVASHYGVNLK